MEGKPRVGTFAGERLTKAEIRKRRLMILQRAAEEGMSQEQIAADLGLSTRTIKNDYHAMIKEFGVKNFAQVCYRYGRLRERKVARAAVLREIAEGRFEPLQKPGKSGKIRA